MVKLHPFFQYIITLSDITQVTTLNEIQTYQPATVPASGKGSVSLAIVLHVIAIILIF